MKKLMIVACAAAFASVVQAATYNWNAQTTTGAGLTAAQGVSTTGTAYLFLAEKVDQSEMWADILDSKGESWSTWTAQAEDTFSLNNGMVVNDTGKDYARINSTYTSAAQTLFVAFKDGDNYFFDYVQDSYGSTADSGTLYSLDMSYGADYIYGNVGWQGDSDMGGAGWYAAPEPTSGLLLLIGMAGLALRRRRA